MVGGTNEGDGGDVVARKDVARNTKTDAANGAVDEKTGAARHSILGHRSGVGVGSSLVGTIPEGAAWDDIPSVKTDGVQEGVAQVASANLDNGDDGATQEQTTV